MPSSLLFQQLDNIQNNFDLQPLLEVEKLKAFGVEYDRGILADLNIMLEPNNHRFVPIKKFFTGHRGCGKSTLLSECAHNQDDRYFTVFFSIGDVSELADVDHTNILFAIGVSMLTAAAQKGVEISPTIKDALYRWFNNVLQTNKTSEGGELSLDLTIVKFKLQRESETREEVRKKFERRIEDLIGKLNEIAAVISDAAQKPVLVIIDDLDKISKPDLALSIYSHNLNALIAPQFSIIYTLPIAFYRDYAVMGSLESVLPEPVLLMPVLKLVPKDKRRAIPADFTSPAIETLCQAIDRRLPDEFKQIIEPDIARQIVLMSGGVLRELIRIVYRCLEVAKKQAYQDPSLTSVKIDLAIFTEAIRKIRLEFQPAIGQPGYEILTTTYRDFNPADPGNPEFLKLLHRLYILEYQNDDMWYDIHPIIENLLRRQNLI
jgi:GTPase SAR1 family protein